MTDPTKQDRAWLALADGTVFEGRPFGARGLTTGEAVFTTTMTGYQEVLTDPSYYGQIVTMTAPEIGNVGVNAEDTEAVDGTPRVAGFVVRDASPIASNWRSQESLDAYLARHGIVGITDVDTRTAHPPPPRPRARRTAPSGPTSPEALLRRARAAPDMNGLDLVRSVTPKEPYPWTEGRGAWTIGTAKRPPDRHVVVLDCGIKTNILRCLVDSGCRLTVVPATSTADDVLVPAARRHLPLERARRPVGRGVRGRDDPGARSARSRSSASASGTSCSRWPSAPGRTSSSSATAAPTSP